MKGNEQFLLDFLGSPRTRLVIPIYQRNYSWEIQHCERLWEDIVAVGQSNRPTHFTGSVVWVDTPRLPIGNTPLLLIDGQQRITTITLLLLALAEHVKGQHGVDAKGQPYAFTYDDLMDPFVIDEKRKESDHYRLSLSANDEETLKYEVDKVCGTNSPIAPKNLSAKIVRNLEYFRKKISETPNLNAVWIGLNRLQIISVRLDAVDNPQLVFESMNSTGKDLTPSDLIRNYLLMGLHYEQQELLYKNYWAPMEQLFQGSDWCFDNFIWNYLTLYYSLNCPTSNEYKVRQTEIYHRFKQMTIHRNESPKNLLRELLENAQLYTRLIYSLDIKETKKDSEIDTALQKLRALNYTVDESLILLLLRLYHKHIINESDLLSSLAILESYLVRRLILRAATNSLNKFFIKLLPKILALAQQAKVDPTRSFKNDFIQLFADEKDNAPYFPSDQEVQSTLETDHFYSRNANRVSYVLIRLENSLHPKDPYPLNLFDDGKHTIEHVMPQKAIGISEWDRILGSNPEETLQNWVHNIGNLTITAYNSELSNGTFEEKKSRMIGGYCNDPFVLSQKIAAKDHWTIDTIKERRDWMIQQILKIWPDPLPRKK